MGGQYYRTDYRDANCWFIIGILTCVMHYAAVHTCTTTSALIAGGTYAFFLSAWDPKTVQKAETNDNNEQTRNGFHSHFNGIAIRVTLMWQPSSV